MKSRPFQKLVAIMLVGALASTAVSPASAMMAPAETAAAVSAMDRAEDLASIQAALENKMVRQRLSDLGLSREEVDRRLHRLSDRQVHRIAQRIPEQIPAGDNDDDDLLIGLGIGLLLVAFVVWLLDALD